MPEIETKIRKFIAENFLFREDLPQLPDTESLLETGVMNSTGVLELVFFLETEFRIEMTDEEIIPENLDSIRAITAFVRRRLEAMRAVA